MEALERVSVLMTLMRRLGDVLEKETRLTRALELKDLEDLQEEKAALADAYEIEFRRLRREPAILGSLDIDVRGALEDEMRTFRARARANADALAASRKVLEGIVRRIGQSAGCMAGTSGGYGRPAAGPASITPLAFNQHI